MSHVSSEALKASGASNRSHPSYTAWKVGRSNGEHVSHHTAQWGTAKQHAQLRPRELLRKNTHPGYPCTFCTPLAHPTTRQRRQHTTRRSERAGSGNQHWPRRQHRRRTQAAWRVHQGMWRQWRHHSYSVGWRTGIPCTPSPHSWHLRERVAS